MVFFIYTKIKSKSSIFFFIFHPLPPLLHLLFNLYTESIKHTMQTKKKTNTNNNTTTRAYIPFPAAIDITTITTRAWNNEIKTNTQKTTSKYNENQKNNENQKIIFKTTASLLSFFRVKTNKTILRINRYRRA